MKTVLILIFLSFSASFGLAAGHQVLKIAAISQEYLRNPIGPMDPETELHLAVSLPLRSSAQTDQFLHGLYDPKSPVYHHYMTPKEFTDRFAPTRSDYDQATAFFKSQGFIVNTSPNRLLLDLYGTVKMVEATFHTTIRSYKDPSEGRDFYAPDQTPFVDLDIPISGISGLDNFKVPHPMRSHLPTSKK